MRFALLFLLGFACSPASGPNDGGGLAGGSAAMGGGVGGATGGGGSGAGGGGSATGGGSASSACAALSIAAATPVDGYKSDVFTWYDAACLPRTAALVRNDATDPGGTHGGFLRELTYRVGTTTRRATAEPGTDWKGWGYVVSHFNGGASFSSERNGTFRTVFAGRHHAVQEFKVRINPGGPVDVTVRWMFATGRSHPIYAVTHDATPAGSNVLRADARSPYGNLTFDGDTTGHGAVSGIGWGDTHRFVTTGNGPLTFNSAWEYTSTNSVPHVVMWSTGADAEMGSVQTQTNQAHPGGADYGGNAIANCQGHTSAAPGTCMRQSGGTLLQDWLWPYQLDQYELPFGSTSKRLAWGLSYGAVGQSSYQAIGRQGSGYPYQSYSVYLVLGPHSTGATAAQVAEVEAAAASSFEATIGAVATSGPAGVGRTDSAPYSPAGYDPIFGTWVVTSAANAASVRLTPGTNGLSNPIIVVRGYGATAPPSAVTLDGATLAADADYFASVDAGAHELWLTLNRRVTSAAVLAISQ